MSPCLASVAVITRLSEEGPGRAGRVRVRRRHNDIRFRFRMLSAGLLEEELARRPFAYSMVLSCIPDSGKSGVGVGVDPRWARSPANRGWGPHPRSPAIWGWGWGWGSGAPCPARACAIYPFAVPNGTQLDPPGRFWQLEIAGGGHGDGVDPRSPANRGWWWGWAPGDPIPGKSGIVTGMGIVNLPCPALGADPVQTSTRMCWRKSIVQLPAADPAAV
jgi:hypothetical protein